MGSRKPFDLILASLLAVLTLGLAFAGVRGISELDTLPRWFIPAGILMALLVPGYALVAGLLPALQGPVVWLLSVALSICLDIVGGLALNSLEQGLQVTTWSAWLGGITLVGCALAFVRRGLAAARQPAPELARAAFDWRGALLFSLSLGLVVLAIFINARSAENAQAAFTQLWAVPVSGADPLALEIGVQNHEKVVKRYNVYVESGGKKIADWSNIELQPDKTWTTVLQFPVQPAKTINVLLFLSETPTVIYRTVKISP
jgi:hypothetical protein